jgi:hypothetical protein
VPAVFIQAVFIQAVFIQAVLNQAVFNQFDAPVERLNYAAARFRRHVSIALTGQRRVVHSK